MRRRISGLLAISVVAAGLVVGTTARAATPKRRPRIKPSASATSKLRTAARKKTSSSSAGCIPCGATARVKGRAGRRLRSTRQPLPCHPKDYLDPKVARNFRNAKREMRKAGITPRVTSAWRSSDYQGQLHKCSLSSKCRVRRGVYGAMPSGRSLHEAGLAVDIASVAGGYRGRRYLTPRGRKIVQIMGRHGFSWRYGLADPVHFEADPRRAGYRSAAQAIRRTQATCEVKLAAASKRRRTQLKHQPLPSRRRITASRVATRTNARRVRTSEVRKVAVRTD